MKILANESCKITDYCGHIILTYLYVDKDKADIIGSWLEELGHDYIKNEISPQALLRGAYCKTFNSLLSNCGCYIFPITENFNENYRSLINVILYQTGVLEANSVNRVIPVNMLPKDFDIKKAPSLTLLKKGEQRDTGTTYYIKQADLPLVSQQAVSSKEGMINSFKNSYHKLVSLKNFCDAPISDKLRERIIYRRIHASFDITKGDLTKALTFYRKNNGNTECDEEKFLSWLNSSFSCGTKVFSFGTRDMLTNSTKIYETEMYFDGGTDFCVEIKNGRSYYLQNDKKPKSSKDVKGTFLVEFLIPVHRLLGANFKCFMSCNNSKDGTTKESNAQLLKILFNSNFKAGNDPCKRGDKLYFSFDFPEAKRFPIDPSFGALGDYLYPQ